MTHLKLAEELSALIRQVVSMKRYVEDGRPKPHKLIMLLAVINLFEQGTVCDNKIAYDALLLAKFRQEFYRYSQGTDLCQPTIPFFHLRGSGFWHHFVKEGRIKAYEAIKKMGANQAWITDNIEYAFLSNGAYSVIASPRHRGIIKDFIEALLFEETKDMRKVGTAFHETMKLRRTNLTQALEAIAEGITDHEELHKKTSLGANEAKTAPGYLRACGLIDWEKQLTFFGRTVLANDPSFGRIETLWLQHYYLCAPHSFGPGFWAKAVRSQLVSAEQEVDIDALSQNISGYVTEFESKEISSNTIRSTANIFLKAYGESDGLGNLHIVHEEQPQVYRTGTPAEIPWRVMAYVLADFWEANWGPTLSIPLAQINSDDGPALLMLLNSGQMNQLMKPMQEAGLVEISRVTRPWTVVRKWLSKEALLEAVYADAAP